MPLSPPQTQEPDSKAGNELVDPTNEPTVPQ